MAKSKEFPQYEFRVPRSFTRGRVSSSYPDVIFIHTTEGSEGRQSAEAGAAYDAVRNDGTSCHFFVDEDTTVQCVLTTDEAHSARTHGNDKGIQIEVCGKAGQSPTQWSDAASAGAIEQCARLGVAIRRKYGKARFPLVNLSPTQLAAGQNGFAEHYDATRAWPSDGGTHTDPGPNFPWAKLFTRITQLEEPRVEAKDIEAIANLVVAKLTTNVPFTDAQKGQGNKISQALMNGDYPATPGGTRTRVWVNLQKMQTTLDRIVALLTTPKP